MKAEAIALSYIQTVQRQQYTLILLYSASDQCVEQLANVS